MYYLPLSEYFILSQWRRPIVGAFKLALGLKSTGCEVYWFEKVEINDETSAEKVRNNLKILKKHLAPYHLHQNIVLFNAGDGLIPVDILNGTISLETALQSDLFLNLRYDLPPRSSANSKKQPCWILIPACCNTIWKTVLCKLHHTIFILLLAKLSANQEASFLRLASIGNIYHMC